MDDLIDIGAERMEAGTRRRARKVYASRVGNKVARRDAVRDRDASA
jgi:hypothetical protein